MAWERIMPAVVGRSVNRSARVTLAVRKTCGRSRALVVATLGSDVATQLGWVAKDRVMVERDPQAGLLRISKTTPTEDGTFTLNGKKESSMVFACFAWAGLPETIAYPAKVAEHEVRDGSLVLVLPSWGRIMTPVAKRVAKAVAIPPLPEWAKPALLAPQPRGMTLTDDQRVAAIHMILDGEKAPALAAEFGVTVEMMNVYSATVRNAARRSRDSAA